MGKYIIALILLIYFLSVSLFGGEIKLYPKVHSIRIIPDGVNLHLSLENLEKATASAYDIKVGFRYRDYTEKTKSQEYYREFHFTDRLNPGEEVSKLFLLDNLTFAFAGRYLIKLNIYYKDANQFPFTVFFPIDVNNNYTGMDSEEKLEIVAPEVIKLSSSDFFTVTINNFMNSVAPLGGKVFLMLSDSFEVGKEVIDATLNQGKNKFRFFIKNKDARADSVYQALVGLTYFLPGDKPVSLTTYKLFQLRVVSRPLFEFSFKGFWFPLAVLFLAWFLTAQIPDTKQKKQKEDKIS